MADNDTDLKIGVRLETDSLPGDASRAEDAIRGAMIGATSSVSTLTSVLKTANEAMQVLAKGFTILGLFNQVVASIRMLMEWWERLTSKIEDAGAAFAKVWDARAKEEENARARRAELDYLNKLAEANERLLAGIRQRHAFEAEMQAMRERAQGHADASAKAELDGALARGEITTRQHVEGTRAIEDAATARRQSAEQKKLDDALALASEALKQASEEHAAASGALQDFVRLGQRLGLANEAGSNTGELARAGRTWARNNQTLERADSLLTFMSERDRALVEGNRRAAEEFIRRAALELNISQKNKQGASIPIPQLAQAVQDEWTRRHAALADAANTAQAALDPARQASTEARQRADAQRDVHAAEREATARQRSEQDTASAYAFLAAAAAAAKKAAAATDALARKEELHAAEETVARRQASVTSMREDYSTGLTRWQERATPQQGDAVAALARLLKRGESEQQALGYLSSALSGGRLRVAKDDYARYGDDIRTVRGAAFSSHQRQDAQALISQLLRIMREETRLQSAQQRVQGLQQREQQEGIRGERERVDQLRRDAEKEDASAGLNLSSLNAGGEHLRAASDALNASVAEAAGGLDQIVAHTSRLASATERQSANTRTALKRLSVMEQRINRLEQQTRHSLS